MFKGKTLGVKFSNFIVYLICLVTGIVLIIISIILYAAKLDSFVINLLVGLGCSAIPTALTAYFIDSLTDKRSMMRIRQLRKDNLWTLPHCFYRVTKIIVERYYPDNSNDKSLKRCVDDAMTALKLRHFDNENQYDKDLELAELRDDLCDIFQLCKNDIDDILLDKHTFEAEGVFSKYEISVLKRIGDYCDSIMVEPKLEEAIASIKTFIDEGYNSIEEIKNKLDIIAEIENKHLKNTAAF